MIVLNILSSPINWFQVRLSNGSWGDVEPSVNYNIAMDSFLASGSGRWKSMSKFFLRREVGNITDYEALRRFLEKNSPISQRVEGRFLVEFSKDNTVLTRVIFTREFWSLKLFLIGILLVLLTCFCGYILYHNYYCCCKCKKSEMWQDKPANEDVEEEHLLSAQVEHDLRWSGLIDQEVL